MHATRTGRSTADKHRKQHSAPSPGLFPGRSRLPPTARVPRRSPAGRRLATDVRA